MEKIESCGLTDAVTWLESEFDADILSVQSEVEL